MDQFTSLSSWSFENNYTYTILNQSFSNSFLLLFIIKEMSIIEKNCSNWNWVP